MEQLAKKVNGLIWYEPWAGENKLRAGFLTRQGGTSLAPYAGLNLSFSTGDDPLRVRHNRELVAGALGVPLSRWILAQQVHGARVQVVHKKDCGRGALEAQTAIAGTDALVTAEPGIALCTAYADCVPLLFYDPVRQAIGAAHAGWKGTVLKIAAETVNVMTRQFGTNPQDLKVAIGPSIGPCCYQVGDEVAGKFRKSFPEVQILLGPDEEGRFRLNLWEANRKALVDLGVRQEQIKVMELCTACTTEKFFSHRAEQQKTGRLLGFVVLHENHER